MEIHDVILLLTSIFGLVIGSGGIVAYFKLRSEVRSINAHASMDEASAAEKLGRAWSGLVAPLNDRINNLQCDLEKMAEARERTATENSELKARVRELEQKVSVLEAELDEWKSGRKKKPTGAL